MDGISTSYDTTRYAANDRAIPPAADPTKQRSGSDASTEKAKTGENKGADPSTAQGDRVTLSGKSQEDPQIKEEIARLRSIEEKVKAHEAAHKSAGGTLAGSVSYTYTRGPDGRNYITGGEVQIETSGGQTPQDTIARMEQVVRAALAPADPSPQDRAVAQQASVQAMQARQEQSSQSNQSVAGTTKSGDSNTNPVAGKEIDSSNARQNTDKAGKPSQGRNSEARQAYADAAVQSVSNSNNTISGNTPSLFTTQV